MYYLIYLWNYRNSIWKLLTHEGTCSPPTHRGRRRRTAEQPRVFPVAFAADFENKQMRADIKQS